MRFSLKNNTLKEYIPLIALLFLMGIAGVFLYIFHTSAPTPIATSTPAVYDQMRDTVEKRLSLQTRELLEQMLGSGNVRVTVRADIDFTQNTQNLENFHSSPSPDSAENTYFSKTSSSLFQDDGVIQKIRVTVLVNQRKKVDVAQLERLVASVNDIRPGRGDTVEIVQTPFTGVGFGADGLIFVLCVVFLALLVSNFKKSQKTTLNTTACLPLKHESPKTWEQLSQVDEESLAKYVADEHPQTAAVILMRLPAPYAAKVLGLVSDDLAHDIALRLLHMETPSTEALTVLEETLKTDLIDAQNDLPSARAHLAAIFAYLDREKQAGFQEFLMKADPVGAASLGAKRLGFEDLGSLSSADIQTLLGGIGRRKIAVALWGASERTKEKFFETLPRNAQKILKEMLDTLGALKLKEVDTAQEDILQKALDMQRRGEINFGVGA